MKSYNSFYQEMDNKMGTKDPSSGSSRYKNPMFDYFNSSLPTSREALFSYCELVYVTQPNIVNAIEKLSSFPVTSLTYNTPASEDQIKTKEFLEGDLNILKTLIDIGKNYNIYGNVFIKLNFGFKRLLSCTSCGTEHAITYTKYYVEAGYINLNTCSGCKRNKVRADIVDHTITDTKEVSLTILEPDTIRIKYVPLAGKTIYFYAPPKKEVDKVREGVKEYIEYLPKDVLEFLLSLCRSKTYDADSKVFMLLRDNLFHLKSFNIAGDPSGWGTPPLVPVLKPFFHLCCLKLAAEAIATEHVTPKVVMHPTMDASSTNMLGRDWTTLMEEQLKKWRNDPNSTLLSPYPVGVQNLGSQGRGITPTSEINSTSEEMVTALGVPLSFLYGDSTLQASMTYLIILENQLRPYTQQLNDVISWIISTTSAALNISLSPAVLTPFTLSSDLSKSQMLLAGQGNFVSKETIQSSLGLDSQLENKRIISEQVQEYANSKEVEKQIADESNSITREIEEEMEQESGRELYDVDQVMATATQYATEFASLDKNTRATQMKVLKETDEAMYFIVSSLLTEMPKEGDITPEEKMQRVNAQYGS